MTERPTTTKGKAHQKMDEWLNIPPEFHGHTPARSFPEFDKCLVLHGPLGTSKSLSYFRLTKRRVMDETLEALRKEGYEDDEKKYYDKLQSKCERASRMFGTASSIARKIDNKNIVYGHPAYHLYKSKDPLYIDDWGRDGMDIWMKERVEDLIFDRYYWSLPMIISTSLTIKEFFKSFNSGSLADRAFQFTFLEIKGNNGKSYRRGNTIQKIKEEEVL